MAKKSDKQKNSEEITAGSIVGASDQDLKRLEKLLHKHNMSPAELEAILKSGRYKPSQVEKLDFGTNVKKIRYGYFSDAHIGHKKFHEDLWDLMVRTFKSASVQFIVDTGDHLEGMSGRPGHIYELNQMGYQQQMEYAAELYNQLQVKVFGIDGNHDQWYFKKNDGGAIVGADLEKRVKLFKHLGQDEGDLELAPGIILKLFHPNDGSAYAISYKLQKLVESFSGGEKPAIVHQGHYHKAMYMFTRNVHAFESGTLCGQSSFMRGKKLPAHMGFGVVDVWINPKGPKKGVTRLQHEWIPYYESSHKHTIL